MLFAQAQNVLLRDPVVMSCAAPLVPYCKPGMSSPSSTLIICCGPRMLHAHACHEGIAVHAIVVVYALVHSKDL